MLSHMLTYLKAKAGDEEGVTIIEYVLMLVLIALAVAAAQPGVTAAVEGVFDAVVEALKPPTAGV